MANKTYDLLVLGSGPAGEKGAAQAAYFGKNVALIEKKTSWEGQQPTLVPCRLRLCENPRYIYLGFVNVTFLDCPSSLKKK